MASNRILRLSPSFNGSATAREDEITPFIEEMGVTYRNLDGGIPPMGRLADASSRPELASLMLLPTFKPRTSMKSGRSQA